MEEILIEKVRQRTFLYDTKSPDYRDQHVRANEWEGIGKELQIKRNFYVSSRDVRIVCPRLNNLLLSPPPGNVTRTDDSVRAVYGVGLRPLAYWDCGLESRREHGYLL